MKKRLFSGILAAAAVIAATGVSAESEGKPITDFCDYQTASNEMETFNILYTQYSKELNVLNNCIEGLVTIGQYGKLVPAMAESWETPDAGKTWVFHIRKGVKWIDNQGNEKADLTAADWLTGLEWVLNFYKNDANNTSMPMQLIEGAADYYNYTKELPEEEAKKLRGTDEKFQEMVGIKVVDDYTLEYTCIDPKPYFDTVGTYTCLYPASQALIDELGVDGFKACNYENMWYEGPYTITSFVQGNEKVLTKNDKYWNTECSLFDTVTIKMVESLDVAYQLYLTGEIDHVDLTESNLSTIYNNESDPNYDYLIECRPTRQSYKIQFNYNKLNEDGSEDTNWDTAIANEAFRKCWFYGIDFGDYYRRINTVNPYSCYNNSYTSSNLAFLSDGTEYTDIVQQKLGYEPASYTGMDRYDKDKFEQLKAQAKEELTAKGVTFPIECDYFIQASDQTQLDTANVLKQTIANSFGDDFMVLNIKTYVSSFAKEIRTPRLHSIAITGWSADYGDPQTFLGQEVIGDDNAFYSAYYSNANDITDEELKAVYAEYTDMVAAADAISDDLDKRYEAYTDAEVYMIEHALTIPLYVKVTWELTKVNDYSKQYGMFGAVQYKNWETSDAGYTAEDYETFKKVYEENRE